MFIHERKDWPRFHWNRARLAQPLAAVRHQQGRLIGHMEALGFNLRQEAVLQTLTEDVLKSSEIEGEKLDPAQVRSSIARRLGMDIGALKPADRNVRTAPMEVVSGPIGKEKVLFQAPQAKRLDADMRTFLDWFNATAGIDQVLKAGQAHLWFVTIHPFDDDNGRIARSIADMALAHSENSPQRFYSMSAQIRQERAAYYHI